MNEEKPSEHINKTGEESIADLDQVISPPSPPLTLKLAEDFSHLGIPDDQVNSIAPEELSIGSRVFQKDNSQQDQAALDVDGELSSVSCYYQRGGRKPDQIEDSDDKELVSELHMYEQDVQQKKKKRRIPPPSEKSLPWSQRSGRLPPSFADAFPPEKSESPSPRSQEVEGYSSVQPCPYCSGPQNKELPPRTRNKDTIEHQPEPSRSPKQSQSGLGSLFNIRRGDKPGPAIGVYVERDEEDRRRKASKKKKKRKARRAVESSEDSDSSDDEKESKRKPVQIRLDLNLEMEVLFKAKIKGNVTITFLE